MYNRKIRGPLVEGNKTLGQITRDVITLWKPVRGYGGILLSELHQLAALFGAYSIYITVYKGSVPGV